jgi:hypothetical protein
MTSIRATWCWSGHRVNSLQCSSPAKKCRTAVEKVNPDARRHQCVSPCPGRYFRGAGERSPGHARGFRVYVPGRGVRRTFREKGSNPRVPRGHRRLRWRYVFSSFVFLPMVESPPLAQGRVLMHTRARNSRRVIPARAGSMRSMTTLASPSTGHSRFRGRQVSPASAGRHLRRGVIPAPAGVGRTLPRDSCHWPSRGRSLPLAWVSRAQCRRVR